MSDIRDHRKSDSICHWDHESWPCQFVQDIDQYRDALLAEIRRVCGVGPYSAGILAVAEQAMENLSPME